MTLTNAVNELTSQHLVSGTARFAGALTTMLKLTVGTVIALTLARPARAAAAGARVAAAAGLGGMGRAGCWRRSRSRCCSAPTAATIRW